jgi:hypothetical protein
MGGLSAWRTADAVAIGQMKEKRKGGAARHVEIHSVHWPSKAPHPESLSSIYEKNNKNRKI